MTASNTSNETPTVDDLPNPVENLPEVKIYSQNRLFYWWPVWVTGYICALVTYLGGMKIETVNLNEYFHPSANPGIIWVMVLGIVLIFTNFSFRGAASLAIVIGIVLVSIIFALAGWWDAIFAGVTSLSIHMNMGFYLFSSTVVLALWAYAFFIHKRLNYYRVRPGQISRMRLVGEGEMNYDTRGAVLEKHREDIFRHWFLGLGSGDVTISTSGARSDEIHIKNVLFIDRKTKSIRKLIAVQPDDFVDLGGDGN